MTDKRVPIRDNYIPADEYEYILFSVMQPGDYISQPRLGLVIVSTGGKLYKYKLMSEINKKPTKKKRKRGRR